MVDLPVVVRKSCISLNLIKDKRQPIILPKMTNTKKNEDDSLAEYIEKCLQELSRLPPFITKDLKADLEDLQSLVKNRRTPRFMLVGRRGSGKSALINAIFNRQVAKSSPVKPGSASSWLSYSYNGDQVDFLDTRGTQEGEKPAEKDLAANSVQSILNAVHQKCPDAVLFLCKAKEVSSAIHGDLDTLEKILKEIKEIYKRDLHIIGIITQCDELDPVKKSINDPQKQQNISEAINVIRTYITSREYLRGKLLDVIPIVALAEYHADGSINEKEDDRWQINLLIYRLLEELPKEAKFHFARLGRVRQFQNKLAERIVTVCTALSGAIGLTLMLPGMPAVSGVRVFMIASIILVSGREATVKSLQEFILAQGLNIGVGEGLETIAKLGASILPGVGNAVFGGTTALGTEAVGRAAIEYFIEPLSTEQSQSSYGVNPSPKFQSSKNGENKIETETKGKGANDHYDEFA